MSDEPTRPGEIVLPRDHGPLGHVCEHADCRKDAGWGFARARQPSHWFCFEHRSEGEKFL
ncbi:MAG: hypothetical protein E5W55_01110 [Mesorhizobium sp.]|nr:MAG: hypothetical protein E5W55_01110 [Mesorhizobium sp.]